MRSDEFTKTVYEIRLLSALLARLLKQDLEHHLDACGARMGALQYTVLRLVGHESQTISELSRKMMIESATLVPVVDALERSGWVERGRDPNDRRRTPLVLTGSGAQLVRIVPLFTAESALVKGLEQLGPRKIQQFLNLLRELVTYMSADPEIVKEIAGSLHHQFERDRSMSSRARVRVRLKIVK